MARKEFWDWMLSEKSRRHLSYQQMADAGAARGYKLDQSSIKKAARNNSNPSGEMLGLIAAAFNMPVTDVMKQAGMLANVPEGVIDNNPSVLTIIKNAQHMTEEELRVIIATQNALIEQRRAKLRGRRNHGNG